MNTNDYYVPDLQSKPKEYKGIGGWLILFLIRLGISTIGFVAIALNSMRPEFEVITFFYILTALCYIVTFVYCIAEKLAFRRWYIVATILNFILSLPDANFITISGWLLAEAIWLIYLYRSKRVANTFTPYAYSGSDDAEAPARQLPVNGQEPDILDRLERLTQQKTQKLITEQEFNIQKAQLLEEIDNLYK